MANSDLMRKYRCEYRYNNTFGSPHHRWTAITAKGAFHVHIQDHGEKHGEKYGQRYSGGVEIHYRHPPEYMSDQPPSHDVCSVLKCPCWHDGSSLQAEEIWIPRWLECPHDHEGMFTSMCFAAERQFNSEDE